MPGCSKADPEIEKVSVSPFCNAEFGSEEECLEHQKYCNSYTHKGNAPFIIPADGNYPNSKSVDAAHWMSELPRDTRLVDLTIPGLHDAATYCYCSITAQTIVKDQDIDYRDAWDKGARAFPDKGSAEGRNHDSHHEERVPAGIFGSPDAQRIRVFHEVDD